MKQSPCSRGFTLVELLVALAVIAILAVVVLFNVSQAGKKARDVQRTSDLDSLQLALRIYKDYYGSYPESDLTQSEINSTLSSFLSGELTDPLTGTSGYGYAYASSSACGGAVVYAESTEEGNLANWSDVCSDSAPGTDTYVIKLK